MATATRRPLPTLKVKQLNPPRIPSQKAESKNGKDIDPIERRLLNIRLHILQPIVRRTQTPTEPTLVFDSFLYIGGLKSLGNRVRLTRLKITHILSVVFIPPAKNLVPSHIKHLFLKADDHIAFNIRQYFEQACAFIDEARQSKGGVLVHCVCGVSRSTSLCCAYLMKHHSMSLEQALVQIRSRRHIIQPNIGFLRQLLLYDEQLQLDHTRQEKTAMNVIIEKIENI
ncbi:unnamed protein product [Rotaria magnacalcarata]|uniref:protein-tyrosine-phosphatase n=3 Tax=Rotaria magnacalcarata TaxID=392030 RepID=A0A816K2B9_9BILA|nr:unnamed protein product [Rotaria magnacalcarata]CAF1645242.1 unnamed protein product [Rotaria magnacalcarata]CAF1905589.1 unnamed protein product [Rotaria magnacalcarata]CAF2014073.1 unnamed protein product [Rotaria magnacalcarata]CAF2055963.1 unnamed protein product [Rotaria magnacalcarata]